MIRHFWTMGIAIQAGTKFPLLHKREVHEAKTYEAAKAWFLDDDYIQRYKINDDVMVLELSSDNGPRK